MKTPMSATVINRINRLFIRLLPEKNRATDRTTYNTVVSARLGHTTPIAGDGFKGQLADNMDCGLGSGLYILHWAFHSRDRSAASSESSLRSEPQGRRQPNGRGYSPPDIRNTEYEIHFPLTFTGQERGWRAGLGLAD